MSSAANSAALQNSAAADENAGSSSNSGHVAARRPSERGRPMPEQENRDEQSHARRRRRRRGSCEQPRQRQQRRGHAISSRCCAMCAANRLARPAGERRQHRSDAPTIAPSRARVALKLCAWRHHEGGDGVEQDGDRGTSKLEMHAHIARKRCAASPVCSIGPSLRPAHRQER